MDNLPFTQNRSYILYSRKKMCLRIHSQFGFLLYSVHKEQVEKLAVKFSRAIISTFMIYITYCMKMFIICGTYFKVDAYCINVCGLEIMYRNISWVKKYLYNKRWLIDKMCDSEYVSCTY